MEKLFRPIDVKKEYDVGYVGDARYAFRARIKGIKIAYTVPKHLKMLHLGWSGKYKVPKNVKVKRVKRWEMQVQICKCKVIIVPYKSYDSCPRIIPEALACGVPVVALEGVQFWHEKYPVAVVPKEELWTTVQNLWNTNVRGMYEKELSMKHSVEMLRQHIEGIHKS